MNSNPGGSDRCLSNSDACESPETRPWSPKTFKCSPCNICLYYMCIPLHGILYMCIYTYTSCVSCSFGPRFGDMVCGLQGGAPEGPVWSTHFCDSDRGPVPSLWGIGLWRGRFLAASQFLFAGTLAYLSQVKCLRVLLLGGPCL